MIPIVLLGCEPDLLRFGLGHLPELVVPQHLSQSVAEFVGKLQRVEVQEVDPAMVQPLPQVWRRFGRDRIQ